MKTLKMSFNGLKLGKMIVTTRKQLENADVSVTMDGKKVWNLFKQAVKEGKITF